MRIEFSARTKRLVASRSGYHCSYPNCDALTIGPGRKSDTVSNTGVAAHIFSAAPSGPRGQALYTPKELESPDNAIWLCETHAKLVDNNRGRDFPPAVLVSYKGLHEAKIARLHRGGLAPLGWFHELRLFSSPLFETPSSVRFGKITFIAGENATGKSALWEWLAAISDPSWGLRRWRRSLGGRSALHFNITYYGPLEHVLEVRVAAGGEVLLCLDGKDVPINPMPTRFVVVRRPDKADLDDHEKSQWDRWSDVERISYALHLDPIAIENILPKIRYSEGYVQRLWVPELQDETLSEEDELKRGQLMVQLRGREKYPLPFGVLSGSEQVHVLMEIGIALSSFFAEHIPTVLIVEDFWRLDSSARANWSTFLSSTEHLFQTVIEVVSDDGDIGLAPVPSWEVVTLSGAPPMVSINQVGATEGTV
jgi:hypothetical protein